MAAHAAASIAGRETSAPAAVSESVTVQIGDEVVGIVAAGPASTEHLGPAERRAWLQAAAAAASVTALIRDAQNGESEPDSAALLLELAAGLPDRPAGLPGPRPARGRRARRRRGGAQRPGRGGARPARSSPRSTGCDGVLIAVTAPGRLLALAPLGSESTVDGLVAAAARAGPGGGGLGSRAATRQP